MKLLNNIINNKYIINFLLIISMTQMFSVFKIFYIPFEIEKINLSFIGSIITSILFIILFLIIIIKDLNTNKDNLFKVEYIGYLLITIITIYILEGLIEKEPAETLVKILNNKEYIYNIILNRNFYIIDIVLIFSIYLLRFKDKFRLFFLNILVYKLCFLLSLYLMSISYINFNNSIYKNSDKEYINSYNCKNTYTETEYLFLIKNSNCSIKKAI